MAQSAPEGAGDRVMPYFPRSGPKHTSKLLLQQLPPPPKVVGPVFDSMRSKEPLPAFDQKAHDQNYGGPSESGEALLPPPPIEFPDRYLVPTLARNERLRLTLLWYHTKQIEQDECLLAEIDTLVRSAQKAIGWEFAIAGILNESTYRRLAAVNLPLAVLPRRESTCSHTINQGLDSVFMVLDMSKDWRFRCSPHSEIGGLRSYAGAPLRFTTDNGVELPLGSLCVASNTPQKPLKKDQRESLTSFSELISSAIANNTRERRLRKRQEMSELLSVLRLKIDGQDYEESAVGVIRKAYPEAHVSLQVAIDGHVAVEGRSPVRLADVKGGLWEDTALIEQTIMDSNFDELQPGQTVRAIVARCGSSDKYVVVAGLDIHHVFDDFDAWFIFKSAAIIADTLQRRLLKQALEARENFLRGITHQLRTPIHGVLSSTELLAEELTARGLLLQTDVNAASVSPAACINTIRNAGQELMRTVNSILKYNSWAGADSCKLSPYDLSRLESDILPDSLSHIMQDDLQRVSIEFRNELSRPYSIVTDPELLKDCLQEVLLNALQSVAGRPSGIIKLTIRNSEKEPKLIFDIEDNGVGIATLDQSSIFQPFYKVDNFKLGAGLGLTRARQIATSLQGTVELVSSSAAGSHFRVELNNSLIDAPREFDAELNAELNIVLRHLPRNFHCQFNGAAYAHFADHATRYLELHGFRRHAGTDTGLVFTDSNISQLRDAYPSAVIIVFGEAEASIENDQAPGIFAASGPLHTEALKQMLLRADLTYPYLADKTARREASKQSLVNGVSVVMSTPQIADLAISDTPPLRRDCGDRPIKALLVDDNPINLRILQMYCNKRKIPYATAADGNIAIEQFIKGVVDKEPFTLVLMDLQMPNCDGIEATKAIRAYERENDLCRSFIFMVTGQDWGKDKEASQEAGIDSFMIKPVPPKTLDKHITNCFKSYQPAVG